MNGMFNFMEALRTSFLLMALVGMSVVTLGIVLERVYYYWKRRGRPEETLKEALRKIKNGEYSEAAHILRACPHPMGPVAAEIVEGECVDEANAEERLQIALSEQRLLFERNLGLLGTMATAAPLVGLLGTVWGIMRAFSDMSKTGSSAPSIVAAGVAEALLTTAVGLLIAIPAYALYNHFARQLNVMLTVAENNSRVVRAAYAASENRLSSSGRRPAAREARDTDERRRRIEREEVDRVADELETIRTE